MRILHIVLVLLVILLLSAVTVCAEEDVEIVGPETVYAREVFELVLWIDRADVTKITFAADFDREYMEMQALWPVDDSAWQSVPAMVGDAYQCLKPGTEGKQAVFQVRLRLKTVDAGTKVRFYLNNVVVWVGDTQYPVGDLVWERTVADIVSDDNYLSEMRITDGVLAPAFSPSQQNYTATVSHHVAQVGVTAIPRDDGASVEVVSPELEYGRTTDVTVTVTAEDGSVRVYTISVTREDAPDRIPSSNCDLGSLEVTDYKISPEFSPNVTDYVLWLPYETTNVEIIATPVDPLATVSVVGNKGFKAGQDNPIYVTCTAEDGTQKHYIITAKRAELYVPPTTETATTGVTAVTEGQIYTVAQDVPVWVYVVVAVAAVTGCAAVGILITDRKK